MPEPAWREQFRDLERRRPELAGRVCRKLLMKMQRKGLVDFDDLEDQVGAALHLGSERKDFDPNRPKPPISQESRAEFYRLALKYAEQYLDGEDISAEIFQNEKRQLAFEVSRAAEDADTPLAVLREKIVEFLDFAPKDLRFNHADIIGTRAALIRRLMTDQLDFISVAKKFVRVQDFQYLLDHMIPTDGNQGRVGGKASGLILARSILSKAHRTGRIDTEIPIPESFFLPSNGILEFIELNGFEEIINLKYAETDEIREEYPLVERLFKSGDFPRTIHDGLGKILERVGEIPLVVRSSSLLEDRIGHAFSGKYKSLFIANRGSLERRLKELEDAIAEVYASIFHPDPIEYRRERGLLDFQEQMGILIQTVVGKEYDNLLLPTFAGVAFSRCEMRWSPRIRRSDGMARLVLGLGTRAVDRTGSDWPVLVALKQPTLRATQRPEEIYRYSQREVDVVDLSGDCFDSVGVDQLMKKAGRSFPGIRDIFSIYRDGQILPLLGLLRQQDMADLVVTFDGLLNSDFPSRMKTILDLLEEGLGEPVDIEFAHDGDRFHLLQCRALSLASSSRRVPLPEDIPRADIVFSAEKFVQTGQFEDIEWIVLVDPRDYEKLPDVETMRRVARGVGALNRALPPGRFILLGPGRWGSRGDIRLGVPVSYSDICHTAVLIEIARRKGAYRPDVSFGTHFFQDLVEAKIAYLPLYPDEEGVVWNEKFLNESPNHLATVVPEYADLEGVLRVLHVPEIAGGKMLNLIMDGEADRALAFLSQAHRKTGSGKGGS